MSLLSKFRHRITNYWPYGLLLAILAVLLLVLLLRGLKLGYYGDGLYFETLYTRLGIRGGMNWLVLHDWKRHLLGGLYSASLHLFFPGQSTALFVSTFLLHFSCGILCFLLADTILRGRFRSVSISAALLFVTFTLPAMDFFEISVYGIVPLTTAIALLSLTCYLRYVRGKRQNHAWREISIVLYCLAVSIYSLTVLFWLIHPVIAFVEDRHNQAIHSKSRWLLTIILDSIWYPLFLGAYALVLIILFPEGAGSGLVTSPALLLSQLQRVLNTAFNIQDNLTRFTRSFDSGWLSLTLGLALGVALLIWLLAAHRQTTAPTSQSHDSSRIFLNLILIGAGIASVPFLWAVIVNWSRIAFSPRVLYPAFIGFALVAAGTLATILNRFPSKVIFRIVITGIIGLWVASGVTYLFQTQEIYLIRARNRDDILRAVQTAIPSWKAGTVPYLLIYTNPAYYPTLVDSLNAKDVNLSSLFQLMYHNYDLTVDVLYYDAPEKQKPKPDVPAQRYVGPYLLAEADGIYSPLRPVGPWSYVPARPEQLVILYYDDSTRQAVLEAELPQEVIARSNIVERVPVQWQTHYEIIGS